MMPLPCPRGRRVASWLVAVAVGLAASAAVAAGTGVFWTTKTLLGDFFKSSATVGFERTGTDVVYIGRGAAGADGADGAIDGYAVVLNEIGQHEPITFGVLADTNGAVQRIEVMAYREAYGHEVRSQRYLRQYVGRDLKDLKDGKAPDAISGATISSRSTDRAVKRALGLINQVRVSAAATTAATTTTTTATAP